MILHLSMNSMAYDLALYSLTIIAIIVYDLDLTVITYGLDLTI